MSRKKRSCFETSTTSKSARSVLRSKPFFTFFLHVINYHCSKLEEICSTFFFQVFFQKIVEIGYSLPNQPQSRTPLNCASLFITLHRSIDRGWFGSNRFHNVKRHREWTFEFKNIILCYFRACISLKSGPILENFSTMESALEGWLSLISACYRRRGVLELQLSFPFRLWIPAFVSIV